MARQHAPLSATESIASFVALLPKQKARSEPKTPFCGKPLAKKSQVVGSFVRGFLLLLRTNTIIIVCFFTEEEIEIVLGELLERTKFIMEIVTRI